MRDEVLLRGKPAQIGSILAQHDLHGLDANRVDLRHIHTLIRYSAWRAGSWPRFRRLLIFG